MTTTTPIFNVNCNNQTCERVGQPLTLTDSHTDDDVLFMYCVCDVCGNKVELTVNKRACDHKVV